MIRPAVSTPAQIEIIAFFFDIPKTEATSAPVHAPVPGSGIATKM